MHIVPFAIIYLILDAIWIASMYTLQYEPMIRRVQGGGAVAFDAYYAIAAYAVLVWTLYFVCRPLSRTYRYPWLAYTAVGFALYAVFNLTNAAIFKDYPIRAVLVDTLWGTTVFSALGWIDTRF